ncbi:MAG: ATP-binding cassette domain-containing protein [Oligoflexia bacterium]|nr:ATP-binding cassette domain-containing protein [Oligoflexia bacterium]
MIEISQLTKRYGAITAINNLNFSVKKGEIVGFLGPNGAGKTTTMKIITGFMAPTSGYVKVAGFDVFEDPIEVKKRIGYLPETPPLYTDMLVADYLAFVAKLKGVSGPAVNKGVQYAIEKTNLGQVQKRLIGNLSKGFRQRVGIAQALVHNPEVLILDEPTVGLDPKQVIEIRNLIKELAGQHTVILSTHVLPEVTATCQRIIIINRGEIAAEDTFEGLSKRMSDTRRFFVRVRRSTEFESHVRNLKGVKSFRKATDSNTYEVELDKNDESNELLAETVVKSGAGLMEFRVIDVSLEDIFLKLTTTDPAQVAGGKS